MLSPGRGGPRSWCHRHAYEVDGPCDTVAEEVLESVASPAGYFAWGCFRYFLPGARLPLPWGSASPDGVRSEIRREIRNRSTGVGPVFGVSGCPAPSQKRFLFPRPRETSYESRRLVPHEGRIAIVTDAGWDAMDAARVARGLASAGQDASIRACELSKVAQDERRVRRSVKSCGPTPDAGCKSRGGSSAQPGLTKP